MASYICENCKDSKWHGGKCWRFGSSCPYLIVENYDSQELNAFRKEITTMQKSINKLKKLDRLATLYTEIRNIEQDISEIEELTSAKIEDEWNKISS